MFRAWSLGLTNNMTSVKGSCIESQVVGGRVLLICRSFEEILHPPKSVCYVGWPMEYELPT